ncbi:MAG TPA: hypothetical protein VIJ96_20240 [Acidothermaceae bacterium]
MASQVELHDLLEAANGGGWTPPDDIVGRIAFFTGGEAVVFVDVDRPNKGGIDVEIVVVCSSRVIQAKFGQELKTGDTGTVTAWSRKGLLEIEAEAASDSRFAIRYAGPHELMLPHGEIPTAERFAATKELVASLLDDLDGRA